jgi:hypothetical protein
VRFPTVFGGYPFDFQQGKRKDYAGGSKGRRKDARQTEKDSSLTFFGINEQAEMLLNEENAEDI